MLNVDEMLKCILRIDLSIFSDLRITIPSFILDTGG